MQARKPRGGLNGRKGAEEVQIERPALLCDLAQDRLDAQRFLFGPADGADRRLHSLHWGIAHSLPGAEAIEERVIGGTGLGIARAVQEQDIDQHAQGIFGGEARMPIMRDQPFQDDGHLGDGLPHARGFVHLYHPLSCGTIIASAHFPYAAHMPTRQGDELLQHLAEDDLKRIHDLRAELGAGDDISPDRWSALQAEQAYFAHRLEIAAGPANQTELFRLIREGTQDPPLIAPRWWFHLMGLRHGAVHVVLTTPQGWFVAQRRSRDKDESPGALDVAVSGHSGIDAPEEAAWREMGEEIGLTLLWPGQEPTLTTDSLTPLFTYEVEEIREKNPPLLNRERRWVFGATLTAEGLGRLRFSDGEVTSLVLIGSRELHELADRCRRVERRAPGELDLAWGIIGTLPRWLEHEREERIRA